MRALADILVTIDEDWITTEDDGLIVTLTVDGMEVTTVDDDGDTAG